MVSPSRTRTILVGLSSAKTRTTGTAFSAQSAKAASARGGNNIVNIAATTQVQVVLVKPERFETAAEIADHLREKRTVVMNL